jgi:hypothetical protein
MKIIKHEKKIISIIYKNSDWVEGLNFITPDDFYLQVGSWWYKKGKKLDAHIHKDYERVANRTQESIYVKKGSVKVSIYTEEQNFLENFILEEGDLAIFGYGGHSYDILEDDTQIIETKNGPFVSAEFDKKRF